MKATSAIISVVVAASGSLADPVGLLRRGSLGIGIATSDAITDADCTTPECIHDDCHLQHSDHDQVFECIGAACETSGNDTGDCITAACVRCGSVMTPPMDIDADCCEGAFSYYLSALIISSPIVVLPSLLLGPNAGAGLTPSCSEATLSSTAAAAAEANAASDISNFIDGPRGLKYQVVKPPRNAGGVTPQRGQSVKALYTLWLNGFGEDGGAKIDGSHQGHLGWIPFEFVAGVSAVIKGWDLAVLDMREGEKRRIALPSALGYGDQGAGWQIPGESTLYFELELVEIVEMPELRPEDLAWLEDNPL